ncbi:GNAT family N-acetyltransferase [Kitasatospora sp. NPDC056327]|uniref:GNAT family N-acetyltransferase n=1 Tax=Kitasatospora sp. NPDC056327 TaxID=3345785 RepID=UPI0035DAAC10
MEIRDFGGFVVRAAGVADRAALVGVDSVAAAGDEGRRASIGRWCGEGSAVVVEDSSGPLGYGVLEYTFFEQGFVTLVMVAPRARGRGVGARVLAAVEEACTAPKLFTSTNVSNQAMQRLLGRAGWRAVGMVDGLDDGDPELFFLCPRSGGGGRAG